MADTSPGPGADTSETPGEARDWGRLLDAASVAALIVAAVIAADVLTQGRYLSKWLSGGGEEDERPSGD